MKNNLSATVAGISMLVLAATTGCGRDNVRVYHVDTNDTTTVPPSVVTPETAPASVPATMPSAMPGGLPTPDTSGLPKLKYTLPSGWKEKPLTQLRVASFEISENGKSADVSVIPLGSMSGGDAANVNRWRGQVGLAPLDEDALKKSAETVEIAGKPAELYDIAGTSPGSGDAERILGAILPADDAVWYFKMIGDADLVEKQKAAFIAFLKSVQFEASQQQASAGVDMSQLPPSHPPIDGMNSQNGLVPASNTTMSGGIGDKPTWTVPAGWQEGELAQFLTARYIVKGNDDASATVNVSQLAGDGGGLLPNVNRWRAQVGQGPISEDAAKLPTIDASGAKAILVDVTGTDMRSGKPVRLIGVILPMNGQTWFYKMMGDANIVAQQKDALIQFVQSARYSAQ